MDIWIQMIIVLFVARFSFRYWKRVKINPEKHFSIAWVEMGRMFFETGVVLIVLFYLQNL